MSETRKLYKVTLIGLSSATSTNYQESYVVATSTDEAYKKVRDYLDKHDLGFHDHRGLKSVEIIAEDSEFPDTKTKLFC